MKIALFASSWPAGSQANGIVTYAAQIVPALRELGHEILIITKNKLDDDPQTIDLRKFQRKPTIIDRAYSKLGQDSALWRSTSAELSDAIRYCFAKDSLDVFEIEESFGWSFAVSKLQLLPVVVRLHGPWFLNGRFSEQDFESRSSRSRQKWEARGIQSTHFLSSPSKIVLDAVKHHYKINPTNSAVVPNPINAAPRQDCWNIERAIGKSLLFIGRFDKRKGGDLVLQVFSNLAREYPELRLTMVGPDVGIKLEDDRILPFESFARDFVPAEFRSRVTFYGRMDHKELAALRSQHFITIVASQYEIMPYAVLEPMSLGCPIVATDVGGIPELVRHRENGLLVPSKDAERMTEACRLLLNDTALAAKLGRQAWEDCCNLYDSKRVANQTIAVYRAAVNSFKQQRDFGGGQIVSGPQP